MPGRTTPLVTDEIYHVFNRGNNRQPTFSVKSDYKRAVQTIRFYRFKYLPIRLSKFLFLDTQKQNEITESLDKENETLIQILSYCLMPNHYHFLLKQTEDKGISKFISNFQNSYTRYFNTKHERDGSIFLGQFKAVRIETEEQLVHVSRYIHLNPHSGYVIKNLTQLETYDWSSFSNFLTDNESFVEKELVLSFFKNKEKYKEFVFDQADYQRKLKEIEHLILE